MAKTRNGQQMTIVYVVNTEAIQGTYNLSVDDYETYFVGENGILVHNCNKPGSARARSRAKRRAAREAQRKAGIATSKPGRDAPGRGHKQPRQQIKDLSLIHI